LSKFIGVAGGIGIGGAIIIIIGASIVGRASTSTFADSRRMRSPGDQVAGVCFARAAHDDSSFHAAKRSSFSTPFCTMRI
jgi:hypothetical protein